MSSGARLAVVGGGRMGGAMVRAWAKEGLHHLVLPHEILVIDPDPAARARAEEAGVRALERADKDKLADLDSVVLAVKPQLLDQAAPALAPLLPAGVLLISILAGVSIAKLQALFPRARIVRAMPNRPAEIGLGATAFVAHPGVSEGQRERARALLEACGLVVEIEDEALMDVVTALSGSGPAYVFALAEAMAAGAVAQGLPPELARDLARATVMGAGAMLADEDADPAALRESVTSPGGTTAAALSVIRAQDAQGRGGLDALLADGIAAATRRGRELGSG